MTKLTGFTALALLTLGATSAFAQNYNQQPGDDTRSGFRDVSNTIVSNINYKIALSTNTGDADTYLNAVNLDTSAGKWDSNINLTLPTTTVDYHNNSDGTNNTYTLGTAISGGTQWTFNAATHYGAIDNSVPDGIYTATLNLLGGATMDSTDTLGSFSISLQVAQKLDIDVSTTATPDTIAQGGKTQLSMTVKNNLTGLNFVSTTWYDSGVSNGTSSLNRDSFDGDWFNKVFAPGDSRTDLHSTYSAALNQELGDYTTTNGVVGGLYNGDEYFVRSNVATKVTVIKGAATPAPSSSIIMAFGLLFGATRLRRRK